MGVVYVFVNWTDSEYIRLASSKMSEMFNPEPMKMIVCYLSNFTTIPKEVQFVDTVTFYDKHLKNMTDKTVDVVSQLVEDGNLSLRELSDGWIITAFEDVKRLPKYAELIKQIAERT